MVQTVQTPPKTTREILPIVLRLHPVIRLTEEEFAAFCEQNREVRIERRCTGELEIMSPTKGCTGNYEAEVIMQLGIWTLGDGSGVFFGSSAGFTLSSGAMRSPDASWILKSRLAELTPEDENRFMPMCPDFVVEARSITDRLRIIQDKMDEYMDNGARLGLVVDPSEKRVYAYRPGTNIQIYENPETVSADPELPGFLLNMKGHLEMVGVGKVVSRNDHCHSQKSVATLPDSGFVRSSAAGEPEDRKVQFNVRGGTRFNVG